MALRYQSPLRTAPDRPARTATGGRVARYIRLSRPRAAVRDHERSRHRCITRASWPSRPLSLVLVAACTTASAGWTYAPAPSTTPSRPSSPARLGGRRALRAVGDQRRPDQRARASSTSRRAVDASRPTPRSRSSSTTRTPATRTTSSIHQGDATGAELFKGDDLQRRRDPDLRRPGARRRRVRLRVHGPSDDDRDAHRPVTAAAA